MKTITFITSNTLKVQDVKAILAHTTVFKLVHHNLELPELQASPDEISINKCMTAAAIIQGPVIVEDTALSFNGLNGLPGPYIKAFLLHLGLEGVVRILADFLDKTAKASCTFAYTAGPNQPIKLFTGSMDGKIVMPYEKEIVQGNRMNWGYIFQPDGYAVHFALLDRALKNKISHRYKALMQLKNYFMNDNET